MNGQQFYKSKQWEVFRIVIIDEQNPIGERLYTHKNGHWKHPLALFRLKRILHNFVLLCPVQCKRNSWLSRFFHAQEERLPLGQTYLF